MTTVALLESLKPGELVIRCADGSLLRTMTGETRIVQERRPMSVRKLMGRLAALKQRKKR
jgi:hypothetical protein